MSNDNDILAQALDIVRVSEFKQLRRDMRYLRRVLNGYQSAHPRYAGDPLGAHWHQVYHAKTECERRLHKRYDHSTIYRMKGVIVRLDKLTGFM